MKKIRIFLLIMIGLLTLASCSLDQSRYPKNVGDDQPIAGVSQYTITVKDFESKEEIAQVKKNEGNYVTQKDLNLAIPEGYSVSVVDETGAVVDLYTINADATVYVKYTVNKYTLCFVEHGVKVSTQEVEYGAPVELIEPTRVPSGSEFLGWFVGEDDGSAEYEATTMPAHAVTLYAKYQEKPYTISFVTDLDQLAEYEASVQFVAGSRLGDFVPAELKAAIEALDKYTLLGWYTDEARTQKFDAIAMPYANVTLYAKWSYAGISFMDGEVLLSVASGEEGTEVAEPTAPAKTGYVFEGWFLDKEFNTPASFPLIIGSEELSIYAKYVPANNIKYVVEYYLESLTSGYNKQETVELAGQTGAQVSASQKAYTGFTFDAENENNVLSTTVLANGSTVLKVYYSRNTYKITYANCEKAQEEYKYGYNVATPTAPTKVGHTFDGFEETVPVTMPASDVTLTAKWIVNQYTITFDTQGGSAVAAITQNYGTAVTAPADPTKTGYTFAGWNQAVPTTMPAESITLTASWTVNQYTITFDSQGGSSVAPITQNYGTAVTAPANPTKVGYTFNGWSPAVPATMPAESITLTASWTVNQYTITFDTQGGSTIAAITQNYGTAVTAPADPTKTGYTFAGWNQAVPTTMPAESITLTASWTVNQYTITFDSQGGSSVAPITQNYGTAVTAPANPTKEGYTFAGWSQEVPATMPAESITLTASWTINQYTITFDTQGGSTIAAITQNYGTAVTAPADPTKTGYTFAGWSQAVPTTMPAEDLTITASWTVNQYTITFDSQGGSSVAPITQNYGTAVTAPANPTKVGYTFNGWSPAVPATMPAESITLTASWTVNQYTITFDTQGGSTIAAITQNYGTTVTAPADPTKNGYDFNGWSQAIPTTMPAEDLTITASWSLHTYTITYHLPEGASNNGSNLGSYNITTSRSLYGPFYTGYQFDGWFDNEECSGTSISSIPLGSYGDKEFWAKFHINSYTLGFNSNGGTPVASITQEYGTTVTAPADPTREGYTFAGWSPALPTTMPGGNYLYTAQWTINQYTITFDTDGGSTIDPITQNYGTAITAPANPTKEGYTFAGWSQEVPATMPAESITLTASWTINQYTITFDSDGGSDVDSITQDYGTAITAPEAPTKEGYEFKGWSPELPATMPLGGLEVTAQWELVHVYTAKMVMNNGAYSSTDGQTISDDGLTIYSNYRTGGAAQYVVFQVYDNGETMSMANKWTVSFETSSVISFYSNYSIVGSVKGAGTTKVTITNNADTSIVAEVTVTVVINPIVTFVLNNESANVVVQAKAGTELTAPTGFTKPGYEFTGWDKEVPTTMPAADTTYTAQWTSSGYSISYNLDGGAFVKPYADIDEVITEFQADCAKVNGSGITAWNDSAKLQAMFSDNTLWAKWSWLISALANATRTGSSRSSYYNPLLADPTAATGYADNVVCQDVFAFVTKRTTTGPMYSGTCILFTTDMLDYVFELAEPAPFTVPEAYSTTSDDIVLPTPYKEGYTFDGWYDNSEFEGDPITTIVKGSTGDVELFAKWGSQIYTISYELNGGQYAYATREDMAADFLADFNAFAKKSYTSVASYWTDETNRTNFWKNADMRAKWLWIWSDIRAASIAQSEGSEYIDALIADTSYSGYATQNVAIYLLGISSDIWNETYKDTYGGLASKFTTINATALGNSYVTYYPVTAPTSYVPTKATTLPATLNKLGYTFAGWYDNEACEGTPVTTIAVGSEGNKTFYAKWTPKQYTITFDTDGGSAIESITQNYGSSITAPTNPTKEGYNFVGWDPELPATMPLGGLEVTAQWEEIFETYNYTFTAAPAITLDEAGKYVFGNITWNLSSVPYIGYDAARGAQFGSGSKPAKSFTLSTADISTKIKEIRIYAAIASGSDAKLTITVGGVATEVNGVTLTTTSTEYVATVEGTGEIVISFSQTSSKALYIKSIEIDYIPSDEVYATFVDNALSLEKEYDDDFTLPTTGAYDSTISWESNNDAIAIDGANATVTRGANNVSVTLTASITIGENTYTKEHTVIVLKGFFQPETDFDVVSFETIEQNKPESGASTTDKYYVIGQISEISNTEYGNMTLVDADGNELVIYGTYRFDGSQKYSELDDKPVVGDFVVLYGVINNYSGTTQIKNAWIMQINDTVCDYTDEEKANIALNSIELEASYDEDFTLPTITNVTWSVKSGTAIAISGNTATVTRPASGESDAQVVLTATYTINLQTFTKDFNIVVPAEGNEGFKTVSTTYTISSYTAGTQYAKDEEHKLDKNTTVITSDCHFTTELRIYSSTANNGVAVIESNNVITGFAFNAGNKVDTLNVYGSNDGSSWTLIEGVSITSTSYRDYTVDFGTSSYKYLKLDVAGTSQVRVASFTLDTLVKDVPTYTITYDSNGGSSVETQEYEKDAEVVAPTAPTKTGYTFAGWNPELPETMPEENLTVTAQWTINQYTITFVTGEGATTIAPITQNYGTAVTAPAEPEKEGYTFNGWDKEIPTTMPAENMIITAQWVEEGTTPKIQKWVLVTDSSDLEAGDVIIILNSEEKFAMSTTQNTNNRGQVSITTSNHEILNSNLPSTVQQITLETGSVTGTFAFNVGSGYLYAASSGNNYLKTQSSIDANASWAISISSGSTSIVAQGSNTRNVLQHNSGSSLFACYGSASQKAVVIYKLVEVDA